MSCLDLRSIAITDSKKVGVKNEVQWVGVSHVHQDKTENEIDASGLKGNGGEEAPEKRRDKGGNCRFNQKKEGRKEKKVVLKPLLI